MNQSSVRRNDEGSTGRVQERKRMCRSDLRILRSVVELRKKQGLKTVIVFLDVRKANDTVWREGLWKKMRGYGIAEKLVKWCELFYKSSKWRQQL